MSVIIVNKDELFEIIQYVNLIKARFDSGDVWTVYPVLYSGFDSIDIITSSKDLYQVEKGHKVSFKFQKHGYEYIVEGEVVEISYRTSATVTIRFIEAKKYYNLRKHMRFEVKLCTQVKKISCNESDLLIRQCKDATMVNLSKSGAMVSTQADFSSNEVIEISANFISGVCFKTKAQIIRKQVVKDKGYNYGLKFIDTSEDNLSSLNFEIAKLEEGYFGSLREHKKSELTFGTKFAIFSSDVDESYGIREALVKLGAENFDVIYNFKFYFGIITEEKPKFIILDLSEIDQEVEKLIENISVDFPQLEVLMILPIEYQNNNDYKKLIERKDVLFKPLIYNEFEDRIIKYL